MVTAALSSCLLTLIILSPRSLVAVGVSACPCLLPVTWLLTCLHTCSPVDYPPWIHLLYIQSSLPDHRLCVTAFQPSVCLPACIKSLFMGCLCLPLGLVCLFCPACCRKLELHSQIQPKNTAWLYVTSGIQTMICLFWSILLTFAATSKSWASHESLYVESLVALIWFLPPFTSLCVLLMASVMGFEEVSHEPHSQWSQGISTCHYNFFCSFSHLQWPE